MTKDISVIIPTHDPHEGRLRRVLNALKRQELDVSRWELVIVDNASSEKKMFSDIDLS